MEEATKMRDVKYFLEKSFSIGVGQAAWTRESRTLSGNG
jgi:hypothetical protein